MVIKQSKNQSYFFTIDFLAVFAYNIYNKNISIIQKRATFDKMSVLDAYDKTIEVFKDYYQYEVIQGVERKKIEKIPEAAFREAIANALIHRAWDVESQIRVFMFDDRVEVVSPGGLPSGITEKEYLSGKISVLRNRNLANVFYRFRNRDCTNKTTL